ncbi:hypothetical protein D3C87_190290 [compost metagenome]
MKKSILVHSLAVALLFVGSQSFAKGATTETENASKALGASQVSEITFEEGKSTLTQESRNEIREMVKDAEKSGKISEIKAAVWADREYPVSDTKAPKADIKLAEDRAKELKKFIKNELKVSDVKTYNMTERPNAMQKLLSTPTAQMKETLEGSGAAPGTEKEKGLFNQKAQASKAVLMIYMKK